MTDSLGWLQICPAKAVAFAILVELDDGEREAISLAIKIDVGRIFLDVREAKARSLSAAFTGGWDFQYSLNGKKSLNYSTSTGCTCCHD